MEEDIYFQTRKPKLVVISVMIIYSLGNNRNGLFILGGEFFNQIPGSRSAIGFSLCPFISYIRTCIEYMNI